MPRAADEDLQRGLYNDTCAACSTLPQPLLDTEPTDQSASYGDLVLSGNVGITAYRGNSPSGPLTTAGLAPFDVSNPAAIVPRGLEQLFANGSVGSLRLVGNRLYFLGSGAQTLYVYDATNPSAPTALGSLALSAPAANLSVDGNRACLAATDGVHIIDVTNPAAPAQVGFLAANPVPHRVVCQGTEAAVLAVNRLQMLDLSDPTNPQVAVQLTLTSTDTSENLLFDGATVGTVSYQENGSDQLVYSLDTYAFTAPATLTHIGSLAGFDFPFTTLSGTEVAFHTIDSVGVIDVSNPAAPRLAKQTAVYPQPGSVALAGSTLFTTGGALSTFDLTQAPDIVVRPIKDGYLVSGAVQGAIAYLVRTGGHLILDDIRDPLAPVELSRVSVNATSVAVRDQYAYVTVTDSVTNTRLVIYDVSDPWLPVQVGSVAGRSSLQGGGLARILAAGQPGLRDLRHRLPLRLRREQSLRADLHHLERSHRDRRRGVVLRGAVRHERQRPLRAGVGTDAGRIFRTPRRPWSGRTWGSPSRRRRSASRKWPSRARTPTSSPPATSRQAPTARRSWTSPIR